MIQFNVLSGKKAGTELVVRHFPFVVGRAATSQLSLDDPGVWDRHFQVDLNAAGTFELKSESNTSVIIDGKTVQHASLCNGEVIEIGLAKILFSLSPTQQRSLVFREWITWFGLGALCVGQLVLISKLLR